MHSVRRCLKGEVPEEGQQDSTYGVEVCAVQAQHHSSSSWDRCETSTFDASAVSAIRQSQRKQEDLSREEVRRKAREDQQKQEEPPKAREAQEVQQEELRKAQSTRLRKDEEQRKAEEAQLLKAQEAQQKPEELLKAPEIQQEELRTAREAQEMLGPRKMDDGLFLEINKSDYEDAFHPRLQCWDLPGHAGLSMLVRVLDGPLFLFFWSACVRFVSARTSRVRTVQPPLLPRQRHLFGVRGC